jgi:hypothetical protein
VNRSSHIPSKQSTEGSDAVEKILKLLGPVVLIPVRPLTKKPIGEKWQHRTRERMKDCAYLRSFVGKNIGVLLGAASGGLCTIDLDNDLDIERLLSRNPRLRDTTQTRRVRGCNFWIVVEGPYPPSGPLVIIGDGATRPFGEWRADGNQTVIHGRAIDRRKAETEPTAYRFLNEVAPIRIRFDELVLPEGCDFSRAHTTHTTLRLPSASVSCATESLDDCVSASLSDCVSASLHNSAASILENVTGRNSAQRAFEKAHPQLARLYISMIEVRFLAMPQGRNAFIKEAVPFLFRAVAEHCALSLVAHFYDCNRALFHDPREQHLKEAQAMLKSVANTYAQSLGAEERRIYQALSSQPERDTFRICRDFAMLPEPTREPLTFFLSFDQLALRLGNYPMQAQRIMRQMEGQGLLKLLEKGKRREPGVKAVAGTYKWLLVSPQLTNSTTPGAP